MSDTEFHGDGSSLSVEETNKLRIKLGLEPLVEEKKQDFVHMPAHNIGDNQKQDKALKRLIMHNEERDLLFKLKEVKPLAEEDSGFINFDKLAKKAEEMRRKKEKVSSSEDENEVDEAPGYTGNDLAGLTVDHSASRFDSFMPTILTLKDSNILDHEMGDVLINVNMADYERYEENVKNKKLTAHYNVESDDEDDLMGAQPKNLLSKYDDEKKKRFVIGSSGNYDITTSKNEEYAKTIFTGTKVSIPQSEVKLAADYYTQEELQAKLGAKRKRKARGTRSGTKVATVVLEASLEDIKPKKEEGEIEEENVKSKKSRASTDSTAKKERPQPIRRQIDEDEDEMDLRPNLDFTPITTINQKIKKDLSAMKKPRSNIHAFSVPESEEKDVSKPIGITLSTSSDSNDQILRKLKAQQESTNARVPSVKEEPIVIPVPVVPKETRTDIGAIEEQAQSSGWQPEDKMMLAPKMEKKKQQQARPSHPATTGPKKVMKLTDGVLGDEVQLNQGVFSALMLAKNKGYLEQPREETKLSNPRSSSLKAQNFYEEKIRYEDIDNKAPRRERYTGPVHSFQDKKDYNPEIKLEYNDEHGRAQEPKEAFRLLSHRFHGKSSGKIKCEKRDSRYKKEVTSGALVGDVAMKSVDKQYSKQKEEKKFCVALSGKNAIIPSSLKKMDKKTTGTKKQEKTSPK